MNYRNRSRIGSPLSALVSASFLLHLSVPAAAQDWDWQVTPYLWAAGIDGDVAIGPFGRGMEMDFSDLVDLLAGAALIRAEGGNADHGVLIDLVWLDLEPEDELATVGGVTEAKFESTTLELSYLRKLASLDIEFGLRYWDLEFELDPALLPAISRGDDWVDGFIGVRLIRNLGERWVWQTRLNAGAGGSDSTFGFETHFARELESGNRVVFGFKALGFDYDARDVAGLPVSLDTTLFGTTVGFMFD